MTFEIQKADCGYGSHKVISQANLSIKTGEIVCLLGKNGSGKTTLFKSMLGLLPLQGGEVLLDGKNIKHIKRKEFARQVAYVPQAKSLPFPFTVFEVVLFGRTAYLPTFASPGKQDKLITDEILDRMNISHLRNRTFTHLSGGEQQMVIIARALAQQPSFLVMDEPASNLDFGNQLQIIDQVCRLKNESLGILMSTHSPDHAFTYHATVALIHEGQIWRSGPCQEVLTEESLKAIYGINVQILTLEDQRRICIYQTS